MKEDKRKKNIMRVLILTIMIGLILSGCNSETNSTKQVAEKEESMTIGEVEQEANNKESTLEESEKVEKEETMPQIEEEYDEEIPDIIGEWEALDGESVSSGTQMTLVDIYGTSAKYGGRMEFNRDGTMFISIGVDTGEDNKGTYIVDNSGIHIEYESGAKDTFYYYEDIREMPVIKAKRGDYYIYFYKI